MLWTIAIIFALVWALGFVTAYTLGGFIHILLGVSFVLLLIAMFRAGTEMERRRADVHARLPRAPAREKADLQETKPAASPPLEAAHAKGVQR